MTAIEVNKQVKIIEQATKAASKNKDSALKFLIDAGIIKGAAKKTKAKK